jgi:hypothetical protein
MVGANDGEGVAMEEERANMTAQTENLAAVLERLKRVERQHGRLKFAGVTALLLAAAGLVMAQTFPPSRTVEAESFVLKDGGGTARAVWAPVPDGGAALTFLDQAGKPRAQLRVERDGAPGLLLFDQAGYGRAIMRADRDGAPELVLTDQTAKTRATLRVERTGLPGLVLYDQIGLPRATLYVVPEGSATLQLSDKDERIFWRVP